jgi:hypothetical protein
MQLTKRYVTTGRGTFQIRGPSGSEYLYCIRHSSGPSGANRLGMLLVYVYRNGRRDYLGRLNEHTGEVSRSARSRVQESDLVFQVVRWACNVLWSEREFPPEYSAWYEWVRY